AFDERGGCAVGSSTPTAASCPTKNFLAISRSSAMALDFATDRPAGGDRGRAQGDVRGESGQVECGNARSASRRLRRSTSSRARALLPPNTKRLVVRRKAAVRSAVRSHHYRGGLPSLRAFRGEVLSWQRVRGPRRSGA